jgi:hypothetical protein
MGNIMKHPSYWEYQETPFITVSKNTGWHWIKLFTTEAQSFTISSCLRVLSVEPSLALWLKFKNFYRQEYDYTGA